MRFVAVERGGTRWHAFCDVCQRPANDQQAASRGGVRCQLSVVSGGSDLSQGCGCVWLSVELSARPIRPGRRLKAARPGRAGG